MLRRFLAKACSNRTIVGLKQVTSLRILLNETLQQSHHCGIETDAEQVLKMKNLCSNRTIVGLKLNTIAEIVQTYPGSNRTIVGLKPPYGS